MTIQSIMTVRVVTVRMDDTLATMQEIFDHVRFHHLLVVDDDSRLMGVISDRDLLKSISPFVGTLSERPRDTNTLDRRAHQIMSRQIVSIGESASIESGVELLLEKKVSCLPVVDANDEVRGVVTWKDLLRACHKSR